MREFGCEGGGQGWGGLGGVSQQKQVLCVSLPVLDQQPSVKPPASIGLDQAVAGPRRQDHRHLALRTRGQGASQGRAAAVTVL